ncbi:hypothetical protein ABZP36_012380 [Zizania latifolia]
MARAAASMAISREMLAESNRTQSPWAQTKSSPPLRLHGEKAAPPAASWRRRPEPINPRKFPSHVQPQADRPPKP